jgi:cell division protein FtsW (lipid II flippase)
MACKGCNASQAVQDHGEGGWVGKGPDQEQRATITTGEVHLFAVVTLKS